MVKNSDTDEFLTDFISHLNSFTVLLLEAERSVR